MPASATRLSLLILAATAATTGALRRSNHSSRKVTRGGPSTSSGGGGGKVDNSSTPYRSMCRAHGCFMTGRRSCTAKGCEMFCDYEMSQQCSGSKKAKCKRDGNFGAPFAFPKGKCECSGCPGQQLSAEEIWQRNCAGACGQDEHCYWGGDTRETFVDGTRRSVKYWREKQNGENDKDVDYYDYTDFISGPQCAPCASLAWKPTAECPNNTRWERTESGAYCIYGECVLCESAENPRCIV